MSIRWPTSADIKQQGINLPKSNDVYEGFKSGSATWVLDTGGNADVVDLSNFSSRKVQIRKVDIDGDGNKGSLLIRFDGTGQHGLIIVNEFENDETGYFFRGHVEKIEFKDRTISPSASSLKAAAPGKGAALASGTGSCSRRNDREDGDSAPVLSLFSLRGGFGPYLSTQVSFILPPLEMLTSLLPGAATLVMAPGTTSTVWASGARAWMR